MNFDEHKNSGCVAINYFAWCRDLFRSWLSVRGSSKCAARIRCFVGGLARREIKRYISSKPRPARICDKKMTRKGWLDLLSEVRKELNDVQTELTSERVRANRLEAERLRLAGVAAALDSECLPGFISGLAPGDTGWPIVRRLMAALAKTTAKPGAAFAQVRWGKPRELLNPKTMGQRITARRLAKGLTQVQLAALAKIPVSTLSHFETGRLTPSEHAVTSISIWLECTPKELISGDSDGP